MIQYIFAPLFRLWKYHKLFHFLLAFENDLRVVEKSQIFIATFYYKINF